MDKTRYPVHQQEDEAKITESRRRPFGRDEPTKGVHASKVKIGKKRGRTAHQHVLRARKQDSFSRCRDPTFHFSDILLSWILRRQEDEIYEYEALDPLAREGKTSRNHSFFSWAHGLIRTFRCPLLIFSVLSYAPCLDFSPLGNFDRLPFGPARPPQRKRALFPLRLSRSGDDLRQNVCKPEYAVVEFSLAREVKISS